MVKHDETLKNLFSHPEMVRDLLRGFVKEEWVGSLDFRTLEKVNTEFISEMLHTRANDVLWKVRWGERHLYIFIMIEFQSRPDHWMALRMLTYVCLLYQDLIKQKQIGPHGKLPPVLPLVLYNGTSVWNASTDLQPLLEAAPRGFERFLPRFEYCLLDESKIPLEQVEVRNLAKSLFALERSTAFPEIKAVVEHLMALLQSPRHVSLSRAFAVWIGRVLLPARHLVEEGKELEDLGEVRDMLAERVKQWVKQWKAEARVEGIAEGREEGRQEGRVEGRQEGRVEGRVEGRAEALRDVAVALLREGTPIERVAHLTGLSPEEVNALLEQKVQEQPAPYTVATKKTAAKRSTTSKQRRTR